MISTRPDYYGILQVSNNATQDEIKIAFRKRMLECHPDKHQNNNEATAKAQLVIEAYKILSKARSKQIYDLNNDASPSVTPQPQQTEEAKPLPDLYSRFKPRLPRNSKAKADPKFRLKEFIETFQSVAAHKQYEDLFEYFEENLTNLEATITSGYTIKEIFRYFSEEICQLFTRLDAEFLKDDKREIFSNINWLGEFLNQTPVKYWEVILNHLGRNWLYSQLNHKQLCQLIGNFTGYGEDKWIDDQHYQCQTLQLKTLFEYLTRDFIKNIYGPYSISQLIKEVYSRNDRNNRHRDLLDFLDGNDHGVKENIKNGGDLGIVLYNLTEFKKHRVNSHFFSSVELSFDESETINMWNFFLKYLGNDFHEKFIENFTELSLTLSQLYDNFSTSRETIILFLKKYLVKDRFKTFEDFMAVLNPQAEEKSEQDKTTALNKDASVQFIHAFGEEHLFNIFLKPHDFENMMKMIDGYKHEPFYAALLLAAVSAYRFDRAQNLNAYTSQLGSWTGYSREQVLEAADSLIKSIVTNKPISTEINAIQRGKVGQVTQRYEELLDPAKSVSMFNGLLLKFTGSD